MCVPHFKSEVFFCLALVIPRVAPWGLPQITSGMGFQYGLVCIMLT